MELTVEKTWERMRFKARTSSIIGSEMLLDEKLMSKLGSESNPVDNISYIVDALLSEIPWELLFIVMQRGGTWV